MTTSNFERVRDFHDALGDDYPTVPTVPSPALLALRQRLVDEEHAEVAEAARDLAAQLTDGGPLEPTHLAPLAHELVDLLYVTYGALAALGIPADAAFAEVHRANLSKVGGPRRADGKVLKPDGFQPASLASVIATSAR
ncbi:hypothetical protein [Flexivirga caeni]|uniref:Phosphoribosyl-ATP diphosphatase n=1 Tax=Flexivirga caeni TaxID=2294115 RepID=A0A3M9M9J8_9MICO|nr:hypothetical protein [Flexivirga caeni]RNI22224.1 hypothetical protein EFY87_09620 [Flexivirga caeni]